MELEEQCIHQGSNIGTYNPKTGKTYNRCKDCQTNPLCEGFVSGEKYKQITQDRAYEFANQNQNRRVGLTR